MWRAALCALVACTAAKKDRAFVSETMTGTVAVIALDRGEVEKRIDVGLLPHAFVASPDLRRLYVANAGSQSVSVIDTASAALEANWLTGPVPDITPHENNGAHSATSCNACHKPGGAKPKYVGGRPVAIDLSTDGARLFVAHINTGELVVLDTATGARIDSVILGPFGELREPSAIAVNGNVLHVAMRATQPSRTPSVILRLDATTLATIDEQSSTSTDPTAMLALPERDEVLMTHFDADRLSELSARNERAIANGPLGITALGRDRVLVLGYYSNSVSEVDLTTGDVATYALSFDGKPVANPTHAALGSDPNIAWIVQSGTDSKLVALDLRVRKITTAIPINGLSFGVAIVPQSMSTR